VIAAEKTDEGFRVKTKAGSPRFPASLSLGEAGAGEAGLIKERGAIFPSICVVVEKFFLKNSFRAKYNSNTIKNIGTAPSHAPLVPEKIIASKISATTPPRLAKAMAERAFVRGGIFAKKNVRTIGKLNIVESANECESGKIENILKVGSAFS
jgi:hypothetical protein